MVLKKSTGVKHFFQYLSFLLKSDWYGVSRFGQNQNIVIGHNCQLKEICWSHLFSQKTHCKGWNRRKKLNSVSKNNFSCFFDILLRWKSSHCDNLPRILHKNCNTSTAISKISAKTLREDKSYRLQTHHIESSYFGTWSCSALIFIFEKSFTRNLSLQLKKVATFFVAAFFLCYHPLLRSILRFSYFFGPKNALTFVLIVRQTRKKRVGICIRWLANSKKRVDLCLSCLAND